MAAELSMASLQMVFPRWRAQLDEVAAADLAQARRLALLRLIWEESCIDEQGLIVRVEALLGLGCFGQAPAKALAEDLESVRQALAAAGHSLVFGQADETDNPAGRAGYWVQGRPALDERLVRQIRGAIDEIDLEQMRRLRQMTPAQRFAIAAQLSDDMQATALHRLRQEQPGIPLENAVAIIRQRLDRLEQLGL